METALNLNAEKVIRVAKPSITERECELVRDALLDNQVSAGWKVEAFESKFAGAHSRKFGVTCNSGTTAIQLALRALDIEPGHTVAMPTLTMVACPNAVLSLGATPVFVDSEPGTGNAVWIGKADAYLAVHLYGVPCNIDGLNPEQVVEDCAECTFGTWPDGTSVGSRGALACFSLYANKIIAVGEGGIVLTDKEEVSDRLKSLRAHAFTPGEHFHHQEHAYGVRMGELAGAIGLAQMERKDSLLRRRREIAKLYQTALSHIWWLETMLRPPGSVWWVYPLLVRKGSKQSRDSVRAHLHDKGIETRSFFKPMHMQPHLKEFNRSRYPVAEDLHERGFYLPLHTSMKDEDVEYIADVLGEL